MSRDLGNLFDKLLNRTPLFILVLGALLFVIAAFGVIPFGASPKIMDRGWQYVIAGVGGILLVIGIILIVNESKLLASKNKKIIEDVPWNEQFARSGLVHAYRIPVDNLTREKRVRELINQERSSSRKLRLLANSGFSYLNPNGKVWIEAGLGKLIMSGEIEITVVLESPFSPFAVTRAIANKVDHHHWQEKQQPHDLVELLQYPNVTLKVTEEAVNCSLFLTNQAIFYDPSLWALPSPSSRTENKFWVFEFDRVNDPDYDCYWLLEKHFDFLLQRSVPLEEVLHAPKADASMPRGSAFYLFFKGNPDLALNRYYLQTKKFQDTVRTQLHIGR
jgi:hypothetical protein